MNKKNESPKDPPDGPPQDENQIIAERRAKLAELRRHGNPFPNDFRREHLAAELHGEWDGTSNEELEPKRLAVTVAGRMMLKRIMGKASFATLQDGSGRIQLYVTRDAVGEAAYEAFKHHDLGDILGAKGTLFRTKTGELSVKATGLRLLVKALRPLPEKFHGLADQEQKYRQRYVDLIMSEETRAVFRTRSRIVQAIREFMTAKGFLEVETPMMQPIPGGANAKPFKTHHNALDMELFLRVAPELYLKRLVVGGFEKVFEINRNFRNEGISTRHNPEFTMLEFYEAYRDYRYLMDLTEEMLRAVAQQVLGSLQASFGEHAIDFSKPFERLSVLEAISKFHTDIAASDLFTREGVIGVLRKRGIDFSQHARAGIGALQLHLFEETTEARLVQPTFITDYPAEVSPLARDRERVLRAERPGGPSGAVRGAGEGQGGRRRRIDVLRCRLCACARVRTAAHGRRRDRHRPPGHALHRKPEHTRRAAFPAPAPGTLRTQSLQPGIAYPRYSGLVRRSLLASKGSFFAAWLLSAAAGAREVLRADVGAVTAVATAPAVQSRSQLTDVGRRCYRGRGFQRNQRDVSDSLRQRRRIHRNRHPAVHVRRDLLDILRPQAGRDFAPPVICAGSARGALIDLGDRSPARSRSQHHLGHLCADAVVLVRGQRDRRQNADDRDHDHQLDQGKALLNRLHRLSFHMRRFGVGLFKSKSRAMNEGSI
jgi:lysyl-tRNA synthetase, class II